LFSAIAWYPRLTFLDEAVEISGPDGLPGHSGSSDRREQRADCSIQLTRVPAHHNLQRCRSDVDETVMALRSKLFAGDPKLEAAATSDAAHITQGAVGEFVRKIQMALRQLDYATIDGDRRYGPATAAAVLAFKQKRDIVNRSYQSQADNVVGKMTMATLDAEMVEAEKRIKIEFDCSFFSFTPRPGPKSS